jgi:hypothetical protein
MVAPPPEIDVGQPITHVDIPDEASLLRRVHPSQIVPDEAGQQRVSTAAFTDPELSVDAEPILSADGLDWRFSLRDHPGHSLVRFPTSIARQAGQAVENKPVPGNRAHTEVIGKKTGLVKTCLRKACEWAHLEQSDQVK